MIKKSKVPEMNELVFCTVTRITPYAAWCKLDEYDMEGMIHISEVAGKWVHDIREFVKTNKQYVAKVVQIDEQKNLVNLSLKRVSKKDEKEKINSSKREQRAEKILQQVAKEIGKSLEEAYEEVGRKLEDKFGELFSALEKVRSEPKVLDELGIPEKWKKVLLQIIEKSFREKEIVLKVDLEIKSFERDGLEKIKLFLKKIENNGVVIKYISAPKYRLEMRTKSPKESEKKLREQLEKLTAGIKEKEIEFNYKFVKE